MKSDGDVAETSRIERLLVRPSLPPLLSCPGRVFRRPLPCCKQHKSLRHASLEADSVPVIPRNTKRGRVVKMGQKREPQKTKADPLSVNVRKVRHLCQSAVYRKLRHFNAPSPTHTNLNRKQPKANPYRRRSYKSGSRSHPQGLCYHCHSGPPEAQAGCQSAGGQPRGPWP